MLQLFSILFVSLTVSAQVPIDYSNCVSNIENGYIDNKGKLNLIPPFKEASKKVVDGVETINISCTPGSIIPKGGCYNYSIQLKRDPKGILIGYTEGKQTATKDELEFYAKTDLELLKQVFFVGSLGSGDVNRMWYKDSSGNAKVLNFDTLTKEDFVSLGLDQEISYDDFLKYRQLPSFSKELSAKMEKAFIALSQNKKKLYVEHGKEIDFEIKDNVCYKKLITNKVTNIRMGNTENQDIFNLRKCSNIIDEHNKSLDKLASGDKAIQSSSKELSNSGLSVGPFRFNVPSFERTLAGQAGYCKRYAEATKSGSKGTSGSGSGSGSSSSVSQ